MALAVPAPAGGVHDPAHQHREQDEGDESAKQGPVHAGKDIGRRGPMLHSALGMEGDLLVGARERPGHLEAPLLSEHEAELARRTQALGMIRSIRGTGTGVRHRAEQVPAKEAVLARRLSTPSPSICHAFPSPSVSKLN